MFYLSTLTPILLILTTYKVLFFILLALFILFIILYHVKINNIRKNNMNIHKLNIAKINSLNKEYNKKIDVIKNEMLKKEEERIRQWMESEKETLQVLNGVSQILELNENIHNKESSKIIEMLNIIKKYLENENKKTKGI